MSKSVDISGYSEEFKQKVLEIYKQEKRQDYVAKILGIPRAKCRMIIQNMKQKMNPKKSLDDLLKEFDFIVPKECIKNLKRDYWLHPVRYGELPIKEDLEYLYIKLNLPLVFIKAFFQVSDTTIKTWCKKLGISSKTKQQGFEVCKIMNLHKYGCEYTTGLEWVQDKRKQTCLDRYGVDNPMKSSKIQQRYIDTCMDRYGVTNTAKLSETQEKMKLTSIERYGKPNISMTEQNKQHLREIFPQTLEKMKATSLEKYGYEYTLQVPEIREAGEQTCLEKYGVRFASQSDEIRERVDNTFRRNGTYTTSQDEETIYSLLCKKFGKQNVERQYKTELYPFKSDFYIIPLALYIEYQGYWKHGNEPFNSKNKEHQNIIQFWQRKSEEISWDNQKKIGYVSAIQTWTVRDPLKRETAKCNNLNWLEFFNMQEFNVWYENL